jgi:hypothetical protein
MRHTPTLKLQQHSLEAAIAIEHTQALQHENAASQAELAVLRAHPDSMPHPAKLQLPELSLALRSANDKLTLSEDALRARTAQFVDMQAAASRAHYAAESAFGAAGAARRLPRTPSTSSRGHQKARTPQVHRQQL